MASFMFYDIIFLITVGIVGSYFIYKNRNKLESSAKIIFLYKTKVGMKLIDYVGKKYKKQLHILSYFIITTGYILMVIVSYFLVKSIYLYVKYPILTKLSNNAPPLALLIPYFPKIFGYESMFPPFYFTYFILVMIVVLIVHEFSHGILMRKNNVKIKSTGLLFLGPMLAGAFVEQDDKQMVKKSKFAQLSILGAGVFANIIVSILFLFLMIWTFHLAFVPSGAIFTGYAIGQINPNQIKNIGGVNVSNLSDSDLLELINQKNLTNNFIIYNNNISLNLTKIIADNKTYFMDINLLKLQFKNNFTKISVYKDFPALKNLIKGTIIKIDHKRIYDYKDLVEAMSEKKPYDVINIETRYNKKVSNYKIKLEKGPNNRGIIGIEMRPTAKTRIEDQIGRWFGFKEEFTEYRNKNDFLVFIYYAFFWIFIVNVLVGLINMLPLGVLDGGRFFYLSVLGITKKEKTAKKIYKGVTWLIVAGLTLMMIMWLIRIL